MARTNEVGQDLSAFSAPELSEADMAEHYAQMIASAVEKTGIAEPAEVKAAVGQMHLLCRVKQENEAAWVHKVGLNVLTGLHGFSEVFFGKEYFLRGQSPEADEPETEAVSLNEEQVTEIGHAISGAVSKTGLAEIVEVKTSLAGQVHLLTRVKADNERRLVHELGYSVLRSVYGRCDSFFGKEYFIKGDKLRYGWVFSFAAKNLPAVAERIVAASAAVGDVKPGPLKLKYGWVLSFGSKDVRRTAQYVGEALDKAIPRYEVLEAPLIGPGTPVGSPTGKTGKKGAMPIRG
jgi:hypothetical protein